MRPGLALDILRAALVSIVFIGCCEAVLEVSPLKFDASFFGKDPLRRFHLRPGAHGWFVEEGRAEVQINSAGYRDRERTRGAHPGIYRIAVVGDSGTAGMQVPFEALFTQVTERLLAKAGMTVEVLNFGTPNYGLAQQYLTLRDDVFAYQPDLVVEGVSLANAILNSTRTTCINDSPYPYLIPRDGKLVLEAAPEKLSPAEIAREDRWLDLENRCALCLAAGQSRRGLEGLYEGQIGARLRKGPDNFTRWTSQIWSAPKNQEMEETWRVSESTLELMHQECRARAVPFWILAMDLPEQVNPNVAERAAFARSMGVDDLHYPDDRICSAARGFGIPCMESGRELAGYAQRTGLSLHGFGATLNRGHFNEAGHAAMGQLLAGWVLRERR